ncbi:hypothetical protein AB0I06_18980 [Streptomyces sp. NPDC050674]|uniref:hypothetical protein n=1 Tax=Streptomyces sp. NPDC050674 TaxID=3157216 RepID=UPI0034450B30
MIERVAHPEPGGDPAGIGLPLAVAHELHPPTGRAAEVASTGTAATRRASGRATARRRAGRG